MDAPRDNTLVETLHGHRVADPFRPLEKLDSEETSTWVQAQNARTRGFLSGKEGHRVRQSVIDWHKQIRNYDRYGLPAQHGRNFFSWVHKGLAPQEVLMVSKGSPTAEPTVLLDPNRMSADGTVSLMEAVPSPDGKQVAYLVSESGSDLTTLKIVDVATGKTLTDELRDLRFTSATWDVDGKGLTYAWPVPAEEGKHFAVYHHTIGTAQDTDQRLYQRPDVPNSHLAPMRTDDKDKMLFIGVSNGTNPENGLYYRKDGVDQSFSEILPPGKAALQPFYTSGQTVFALTDKDAPRNRLVAIDLKHPEVKHWRTLVPESPEESHKLKAAFVADGKILAHWSKAGSDGLSVYTLEGKHLHDVDIPEGSILQFNQVRPRDKKIALGITGFLSPRIQYEYDVAENKLREVKKSGIARDLTDIAGVERLYATSKDGTRVPMWVIKPKHMKTNGDNPTLMYGYGGFGVSLEPNFSYGIMHWVENGGVFVMANIRGGGELGRSWYEGGRKQNKQNSFDDFAACAETLIKKGYTRPGKLAIKGGSNGGLLTLATSQQRPDLFGAVISQVPVADVLRFHTDNYGAYWMSDYGDPGQKDDFENALKFSPLHTVKPADQVTYPPTMITTADHDNRVAPWHAYKQTAERHDKGHEATTYLRVDSKAGHGAGKPTQKVIDELADEFAFLHHTIGPIQPSKSPTG